MPMASSSSKVPTRSLASLQMQIHSEETTHPEHEDAGIGNRLLLAALVRIRQNQNQK
jgi:hypothetical protein